MLDIMGGRVVRAVGGRRGEYRPIKSMLTDSTEPGQVAKALVAATGAECLYVADLDGIMHRRPDLACLKSVQAVGVPVLCDAGFRTSDEAKPFLGLVELLVVGTETTTPPILSGIPRERLVVSIDLMDGRIVGDWPAWGIPSSDAVVELIGVAIRQGFETYLILDLARVGMGQGPGTEELIAVCKKTYPPVNIIAGGGVRTWADVDRLGEAGADAVLVASALHDGTLTLPRPAS